jgi:malate dehydrogenase
MPKDKDFKRLVRERSARTGESYSTARAQLLRRTAAPATARVAPVVCAVTGAAGRVAYNLLFRLSSGEVFGPDVPVALRLVDVDEALPALEGVVIELEDCSYPLLASVDATSDYTAGFADASWLLLLGAPRRTVDMERRDLLAATAASFAVQGQAVAAAAADDVRVLVVGNPANTNCLIARRAAAEVPGDRWFAMLRLDHNRARSQLAQHAGAPLEAVSNISVWGNHSPTMVADAWHARIDGRPACEVVDEDWIASAFVPGVQQRGAHLIEVAGASSAASAATALADSIHDIANGTRGGDWTTAAVVSHGEYGIPEGLQFGFPVSFRNGSAHVVEDLDIGSTQQALLDRTVAELVDERDLALHLANLRQ